MALVYGIDTGSWKVRLSTMEGSFGRFTLRDVQEVAVLPDQGGGVPLGDALSAVRDSEPKWEEGDRAAALPLDAGVVRLVKLPFTEKQAVARAVPAEVEAQVPYDLDDMVLVTRSLESREGQSRTVVHIAARDAVEERITTLKEAGADPRHLCLDAAALVAYADRGVQAVVDVGHRRTLVAVTQGGEVLAARVLPFGGEAVTRALADALGLELAEAEAAKHSLTMAPPAGAGATGWEAEERTETNAVPPGGAADAASVARSAVDAQLALLRAELIAVEDDLAVGVDEVLLAGGGSRLGGFAELLSARLGVPARSVVVPGGYPADCALAVALARVAAGDLSVPDLRVDALAFHGAADLLWTILSVATVAAGAALVAGGVLFGMRLYDGQDRLSALQEKIADVVVETYPSVTRDRVTDASTALAIMQQLGAETQARVERLGGTVTGIPPMLEMLKSISERVPSHGEARIDVRELTIASDSVTMKAETDSYETAAKIESAVKSDPRFAGARKGDEKKSGDSLTFSLTIPLNAAATDGEEG